MNLVRNWSLVAVTAAVFSSSALAHADQYGPATNRNNPARSGSEDKTAFFGLCWPFCGYNRGCGYGNGYSACPPYGYGGSYYGGGCCPRPSCAPCGPCGPTGGGYGGYGYGAGYPYGGYGGAYGGVYGGGCGPAMYSSPMYAPPPCGLPAYGAPCYQGLGYNAEDNDRPASAPSFTARRRNNRPALAEEDSPFFQ